MFSLLLASALLTSAQFAGAAQPDVVINEVDADQVGTDSVEYFELFGTPNASLDGLFAVFFNGNAGGDAEYEIIDLTNQTIPADGYFVIGVATVPNVDFVPGVLPATNAIQNGTDAIALYFDPSLTLVDSDFFGATPTSMPAGTVLIDAVVYDTGDADDAALLAALTPAGPQVDEDGGGAKDTESIGRCPDGGAAFDTATYTTGVPTPGGPNSCGAPSPWSDQGSALAGAAGDPLLEGSGDLTDGSSNQVDLSNAASTALTGLFLATDSTPIPFKGGTILPFPFFEIVFLNTTASGTLSIPFTMPSGIPAGVELWVQFGISDAGAPVNVALSNAILGVTP